jgi:hypothetical protein
VSREKGQHGDSECVCADHLIAEARRIQREVAIVVSLATEGHQDGEVLRNFRWD